MNPGGILDFRQGSAPNPAIHNVGIGGLVAGKIHFYGIKCLSSGESDTNTYLNSFRLLHLSIASRLFAVKHRLPLLFFTCLLLVGLSPWTQAQVWLPHDVLHPLDRSTVNPPSEAPDFTLDATEAFQLPAEGQPIVRNFVISSEALQEVRHIQAVELIPAPDGVAKIGWVRFDSTNDSRFEDEKDKVAGFPNHPQSGSLRQPHSLFAIWTPRNPACIAPLDSSWRVHPRGDIVVTLVLEPNGQKQSIRPRVNLWYAKEKKQETQRTLVAETDPNDPENGVLVPLDVEGGGSPEVLTLRMANETIDIKPGMEDYSIRDTFELRTPAQVTGIFPHAHGLATKIRVDAFLPNNQTERIFEINEWRFGHQEFYRFEKPLALPEGTRLEVSIRYRNLSPKIGMAAQRVRWGGSLGDEMGEVWVQMVVQGERHALAMSQKMAEHQLKLEIEAWEGHQNGDPDAHTALAFLYADLGASDTAVAHGRKAVSTAQGNEQLSMAHTALGAALITKQFYDSAQQELEKAIELNPDNGLAYSNLGTVFLFYRTPETALENFVLAAGLMPKDYRIIHNLGITHLEKEEFEMAKQNFESILEINPLHAKATASLGAVMDRMGEKGKAVDLYRRALMLSPEMVSVLGPEIEKVVFGPETPSLEEVEP